MHVTAKLVLKLADFKVERTVGVDKDAPSDLRGQLEPEAREALGDLCNLIYDEAMVRRAKADQAIAQAKRATADPRQTRLSGTDGDGSIPQAHGGLRVHHAPQGVRLPRHDGRGVTASPTLDALVAEEARATTRRRKASPVLARSMAILRREGYVVAVVERWNPHVRIRQDLYGFLDSWSGVRATRNAWSPSRARSASCSSTTCCARRRPGSGSSCSRRPGAPMAASRFNRIVARWGKAVGVTLHPHLFRHTYATGLVASGVPIDVVQEWLGHGDLATTAEYLHAAHNRGARDGLEGWAGAVLPKGYVTAPAGYRRRPT